MAMYVPNSPINYKLSGKELKEELDVRSIGMDQFTREEGRIFADSQAAMRQNDHGNLLKALEILENLIKKHPNLASLQINAALIALTLGDKGKTKSYLRKIQQIFKQLYYLLSADTLRKMEDAVGLLEAQL